MNKFVQYIILSNFLLLIFIVLNAQKVNDISKRWDQNLISEAGIWQNLLVNYIYADHSYYWHERKQALIKVIVNFPNSKWADDASILSAGEKATNENNIDGAISELREIIKKYPSENTIVVGWNNNKGCQISEAWLMWAPGLVALNEDYSVRTSFPFDKDSSISTLENEVLTYFEHLDKYPNSTKDVAQYIIALMLRQKGDILGAISELEDINERYSDLSKIRKSDFEAAKGPNGYLIECEPPFDVSPIWRVQYSACLMLIDLYSQQKNQVKVEEILLKIASDCSPDGWYWNVNKYIGNVYALINLPKLASKQYDLSIKGIKDISKNKIDRMKVLFEEGYLIKSKDFTNWEDEVLKSQVNMIAEIEYLKDKLTPNK